MTIEDKTVSDITFISFLERLVKDSKNPVFLILDNHPIHKSGKVKAFLEKVNSQSTKHKLYFLPKYSPELNPDELVWSHVKHCGISRDPVFSKDELKSTVKRQLHQLQKDA